MRKPESLVNSEVLVGIVGVPVKSLYKPLLATVAKSASLAFLAKSALIAVSS